MTAELSARRRVEAIAGAALAGVLMACNSDGPPGPRSSKPIDICNATHVRAAISSRMLNGRAMVLRAYAFEVAQGADPRITPAGIAWASADSTLIRIEAGQAHALRVGFTTLTATACGVSEAVGVTVLPEGYGIEPVEIAGATLTIPIAFNDSGQVAGTAATPSGYVNFLWQSGQLTTLGDCLPQDLNNQGMVLCNGAGPRIWDNGSLSARDSLSGTPLQINDAGQVLIERFSSSSLLWRGPGDVTPVKVDYVDCLNNPGDVLGVVVDSGRSQGALWRNGVVQRISAFDIGYNLVAVSDSGDVLATASNFRGRARIAMLARRSAGWRAELLSGNDVVPNELTATAVDINGAQELVGDGIAGPFVWMRGKAILLNDMLGDTSWTIQTVRAINSRGQILAIATRGAGGPRTAAVLNP